MTELKSTILELRNSLHGLKRMEMIQDRISELEDTSREVTQYEEQYKKDSEEMNRASMSYRTISKGLTCESRVPERKEEMGQKKYIQIMSENFTQFNERH